jgi:3-hydroxy-5-methyl-1-naphthoate 3-O-methyltransferase
VPSSALTQPVTDPTTIFELFRGSYATELLAVAVIDFDVFGRLAQPKTFEELRTELDFAPRPANVLITALRAMGLLDLMPVGKLDLSPIAREHLFQGAEFDVAGYIGLAAESPGVRRMAELLKTNRPVENRPDDQGAAFIFREGLESAMDQETSARRLTLALAGRAKNVAPHLAANVSLDGAKTLLDVGGGSGIHSIAFLQKNPQLRAIVWDRAEVLKVAREMAEVYGVVDRLELLPGDMFADPVPSNCDVVLLSNILHDWDVPECRLLLNRCAEALPTHGRLLIHDVFLNDDLGGPLPVALYSAALFSITEGRAYSAAEYREWLREVGLSPAEGVVPTLVHCGVVKAYKI